MSMISRVRWGESFKANPKHREHVAERLLALKNALGTTIHAATSEHSLRLATWNIMHFGDGGGYNRSEESMLYIAEIIDHFDLVAVQEVNRDISKLHDLMENYLGDGWDYLVTDTAGGNGAKADDGNNERLAFLYRKAKVQFCKEVGEIVLPNGQEIAAPTAENATRALQFARTPFAVSFRSGWFKFKLCTVHIFYGKDQADNSPDMLHRQAEIDRLAGFLSERQEAERVLGMRRAKAQKWAVEAEGGWDANYILLGDFNIISPGHQTMQALERNGFTVETKDHKTNLSGTMHYDQIAHKTANPHFRVLDSGVFDMFASVYRDVDAGHFVDHAGIDALWVKKDPKPNEAKRRTRDEAMKYFRDYYRKHQMSDHKLLWAELSVDYSGQYLQQVIDEVDTPPVT